MRYDEKGEMVKGWQTTAAGVYYFELTTGAMAKGNTTVDGVPCAFSWSTGIGLTVSGMRRMVLLTGMRVADGRDWMDAARKSMTRQVMHGTGWIQ